MNKFIGCGRMTRDAETRYSQGENPMAVARWTLAIDRRIKKAGEQEADFINCVAFGKTAEFVEKYFSKGMKMIVEGRINTGSYLNKDNVKIYTTDIAIENVEFAESKGSGGGQAEHKQEPSIADANNGFMSIPGNIDDSELPFN
jgi:single-strand DNA-binding protein